jgi:cellulose synthase/poly-beta-1,6-N-acetylglucosamine synthase-like glycosyltransferase
VAGELSLPFEGLATPWLVLFTLALVVIVVLVSWTAVLFANARRALRNPAPAPASGTDSFTWIFLVPALNEEVTIADSVARLLEIDLAQRRIIVIDDGSDDRTPEILGQIDHSQVTVLRREPPDARKGKAAALNHAYRALDGVLEGVPRSHVIVAIVDADGRLDPEAPRYVASHFEDDRVGGVQTLVRIYNRKGALTRLQDLEFGVYGCLFQQGRNRWGTAGMGGNGQFNRLLALDDIAAGDGPWHDRLTEDQDLGLRMIGAGWQGHQELRAVVDQQGLSRLGPLFRQRTRWSQGNLQAIGLTGVVWRAQLPLIARVDLLAYLLMPLWQGLVGASLIAAIFLAVTGVAAFWSDGQLLQLFFFYLLAFGGTMLGCIAARAGAGGKGGWRGFLIAHVYAFYSWLLWPVLLRSTVRQLMDRGSWAKTQREALAPP